jgi:hypothetical protein
MAQEKTSRRERRAVLVFMENYRTRVRTPLLLQTSPVASPAAEAGTPPRWSELVVVGAAPIPVLPRNWFFAVVLS